MRVQPVVTGYIAALILRDADILRNALLLTIDPHRYIDMNMLDALLQLVAINIIDRRIGGIVNRFLVRGRCRRARGVDRLVRLINPEAHAAADDENHQNPDGPGEYFGAAGAALSE